MSTRFYAGQQDYIIQLNLMDDEFDAAVASVSGKANSNNGVFTGTTTIPVLYFNRTANQTSGIQWYNSANNVWQEYMATGGTTSQGPKGNLTAPTGTLVTGLALRSVIDNTAGNGWTWETNTAAGTAPAIVAEISSTGDAKFSGNVQAASFTGNASSSTYATNTTITNDTTTNATMYVTWVTATSGNMPQKVSSTKLTFNPSTGALTAPSFIGALTGNATSSTTTAITDDVATATAVYPMWTTAGTGNLASKVSTSAFSFVPSTSLLTLNRGQATNTALEFKTTSGSVYAGQGAANTFAVKSDATLSTSPWLWASATDAGVAGNFTVQGNLTVNGTTTTVNSTTVTLDDPVLTLGGDTAPTTDDGKDRGIEFRWHNGTVAKLGFFGFDDSTGRFTFIPDATNASEVYSGTKGSLDANLVGNVTGNADTATKLATSRTITLTGDVTGSVGFDGTANVSITATVGDDSHNHNISTVNGLQTALDNKYDKVGGVIGNQATGWSALNASTARVVDTNSGGTGGLAVESNAPVVQLIDKTASATSARMMHEADTFRLGFDTSGAQGTYTDWLQISAGGYAAFGGAITANVAVTTRATITGSGTTQYGHLINTTFNTSGTSGVRGIEVQPILPSSSYTVANLSAFSAGVPTVPAAVTVTEYSQFRANDFTPTGTVSNKYGFRGNIASGTNFWNLFMEGSASNYLNGKLLIGSTSDTGEKLQVTGTAKFTGSVTIPTEAVGDNSTKAASTAFTQQAAADAAVVYAIVFG